MSKRESPVGLISVLLITFGLSIAGIWSAYQIGFVSDSDIEYTYTENVKDISAVDRNKTSESKVNSIATPKPTPTATPKKLKTAEELAANPVQTEIQFLFDSNKITTQGVEKLNQLKNIVKEFDSQTVAIRVYSNFGESEFSRKIGRQRGEEVAGYLRHLGLKNKIIISRRNPNPSANSLSSEQKRNQPMVVRLYKL
ncbi:outer membrane protein/peptidoglycan-associated (lipo)protein [Rivularia sp. PCC 7116]|uniref:hypothetical protein n=1 Tax=Rivularia sp. PCC 7116 TaxID=373994 RepID=UPI00029ED1A0|nr:hypothetical protein [Rivularia sp. PCC 7116]AFY55928.1 outer membrane protein/peptidoglycan-associated (lipo)protein [Rivularia sp. PCC 7116]